VKPLACTAGVTQHADLVIGRGVQYPGKAGPRLITKPQALQKGWLHSEECHLYIK